MEFNEVEYTHIEGGPYHGITRIWPCTSIVWEAEPMQRVRLVVPFHTTSTDAMNAPDNDSGLDGNEALDQVNVEVQACYGVQDAAAAQPLIEAAEVLGFRCVYDSHDPNNDDELGTVTITMPGIAE